MQKKSFYKIFLDVVCFVLKFFFLKLICVFFTSYATTHCTALAFSLNIPDVKKDGNY
jgi:hypothetical protein